MGCTNQAGEDNRNVARLAGLLAGLPVERRGGRYGLATMCIGVGQGMAVVIGKPAA